VSNFSPLSKLGYTPVSPLPPSHFPLLNPPVSPFEKGGTEGGFRRGLRGG